MLQTTRGLRGVVTSPHHAASQAGLDVLRDGGSAVEAAVAVAATLAVVYPQMNSIGGDGFWLIAEPGSAPIGIDACGRAAAAADLDLYARHGLREIPRRGPLAANTVAGTVSGWAAALAADRRSGREALPLRRLLRAAIEYADEGVSIAASTAATIGAKRAELESQPGFADVFLPGGVTPAPGFVLRQPALARTLTALAEEGLDSFYRGALAERIARDLAAAGAPVSREDLARHRPVETTPLQVDVDGARLFNMPPPTQGVAALLILALFDRLQVGEADGFAHLHGLIEATKRAFRIRDRHVCEPEEMTIDPQALLDDAEGLDRLAGEIDPRRALRWPLEESGGDTVWLGVIDGRGQAVSMIQSTYFEFGSGVVLGETGITWQNRGSSFALVREGWNRLRPGARPFHTLNPAMARFADGRVMAYGTMGGEGQPQTQAAVFTRYARFGQDLQAAVSAPRWLLGRTWGASSTTLKLEARFAPALVETLRSAGHDVETVAAFDEMMGHAGAVVRHPDGRLEGATDPRSDGGVAAF
ncbi:MAG TPA: gamma-glutamyltransferase family protein [Caulobacteraceae bacterium]|nr:gamma-glutamyltransferase family protein [Caulobacteraceae bacterium]